MMGGDSNLSEEKSKEIIELMCSVVERINRDMASQQGPDQVRQIEEWLAAQRPQLEMMNGVIFHTLVEHGIIK